MKNSTAKQALEKPRQGEYVSELIDATQGHAKRLRRVDEHPLTLAHERGRLNWKGAYRSDDRFAAGDRFREMYEMICRSGKDSTHMGIGGRGEPFTEAQQRAGRYCKRVKDALKPRDYTIIEKFCGEGWSMAEAVKAANLDIPDGVVARVCEALDELVEVVASVTTKASVAA